MRIRDFIKDRITLSEELVEYKEFKDEIIVLSTNVTITNGGLSQVANVKRVQKFILHNGQERLFDEDSKTVHFNGPITAEGCNFSNFRTSNSESKIFIPLNNALNGIQALLDIIPQITS